MGFLRELELQGKTVLDVGCGTGEVSIAAARAGAARVIGLDIAPRMIRSGVARCRDHGRARPNRVPSAGYPHDRFPPL